MSRKKIIDTYWLANKKEVCNNGSILLFGYTKADGTFDYVDSYDITEMEIAKQAAQSKLYDGYDEIYIIPYVPDLSNILRVTQQFLFEEVDT